MASTFGDIAFTAAVYDPVALDIDCTGLQFGENQYTESAIDLSLDGGATWTIATTITAWANAAATGLLAAALAPGTYSVRLTTSDNTPLFLLNHFIVANANVAARSHVGIGIGIGIGI
jgi:hypothetical protein